MAFPCHDAHTHAIESKSLYYVATTSALCVSILEVGWPAARPRVQGSKGPSSSREQWTCECHQSLHTRHLSFTVHSCCASDAGREPPVPGAGTAYCMLHTVGIAGSKKRSCTNVTLYKLYKWTVVSHKGLASKHACTWEHWG